MTERYLLLIALLALLMLCLAACTRFNDPAAIPTALPSPTLRAVPNPTDNQVFSAQIAGTSSADESASQALNAELDNMLQTATKQDTFSGSVLVAQNGRVILHRGYGFADREENIRNTSKTRIPICSITKQFTAMAISILQEQGKLNLQDSLCQHLANCPETWKQITIFQLLSHTSGLPDPLEEYWTQDVTSATPLERLIEDVAGKPLEFQPGAGFSYNNTGYILLGKVIENASGQSYETFLQENIFQPLKMLNTGFDPTRNDLAIGYKNKTMTVADPFNMWVAFSAGALYSTVDDIYLWDQALYTNKLVPEKVLNRMFTAQVLMPDANGIGYGYGWVIGSDNHGRFVAHEGMALGYRTSIIRYLEHHAVIILLINQEDIDPNPLAALIANKLFGEE